MERILAILIALVIVVMGLLGPATAQPPIGIDEAIEILIDEVIQPETLDHDIVAYMLTEPLRDGDEVTPEIGEGVYEITEDTYFIFVDDYPMMFFGHPIRFVFIKAATSECEVGNETWPPLVNGESIIRLEELGQVELLRFYSTSAKPNPITGISSTVPEGDYGDAPDGQEAYWWVPSVGGPVVGSFPTLYDTTNSIFDDPGGTLPEYRQGNAGGFSK